MVAKVLALNSSSVTPRHHQDRMCPHHGAELLCLPTGQVWEGRELPWQRSPASRH